MILIIHNEVYMPTKVVYNNAAVGGVITLNDIICKPVTTHGQGEVIIEQF